MREKKVKPLSKHIPFIDNLKILLTLLVVSYHIALAYGPLIVWDNIKMRYNYGVPTNIFLGAYLSVINAFFMGLFFLLSGFLAPASYDRRGFWSFFKARIFHLGLPLLFYILIITPLITYAYVLVKLPANNLPFMTFYKNLLLSPNYNSAGVFWFNEVLLLFDIIYALFRLSTTKNKLPHSYAGGIPQAEKFISHFVRNKQKLVSRFARNKFLVHFGNIFQNKILLLYVLLLSVATFIIRLFVPNGFWIPVVNVQLGSLPQYVSAFLIGIIIYRNNLLPRLSDKLGFMWFKIGIFSAFIWQLVIIACALLVSYKLNIFLYAFWETLIFVSLSLGLIVLFRNKFSRETKISKILSKNAYAVYFIHAPIIVAFQFSLNNLNVHPLIKIGLISVIGIPICFLLSRFVIRKLPLVNKIF